jgi:hypothetical protein
MRILQGLSDSPSPSASTTTSNSQTHISSKTSSATISLVPTYTVSPSYSSTIEPSYSSTFGHSYSPSVWPSYSPSAWPSYSQTVTHANSFTVSPFPTIQAHSHCECPNIRVPVASPTLIPLPVINTSVEMACFPSTYLLAVGVPAGCVLLIILGCVYNFYRKYRNLKMQFISVNTQLELQKATTKQFQVRNILGRSIA